MRMIHLFVPLNSRVLACIYFSCFVFECVFGENVCLYSVDVDLIVVTVEYLLATSKGPWYLRDTLLRCCIGLISKLCI